MEAFTGYKGLVDFSMNLAGIRLSPWDLVGLDVWNTAKCHSWPDGYRQSSSRAT